MRPEIYHNNQYTMKRIFLLVLVMVLGLNLSAQQRRPVDNEHPMWLIHVDVWNKADPQKIIDLIPENIRPYAVMNLSLSCGYDTARQVYKMPQNAMKTYKSWGTVCQQNGMWFTCQPASGGHTHLQDDDLETFEYMFKAFPNFLGWNYAEQFWGFDEPNDKSSSSQVTRIALFAKLVEMSHKYGGFLTISFCGNVWSHPLNPVGMMKRNKDLLAACQKYPEAILWLYKYTTSSCFYNNESVTWSPYVAGLAKNYGVRYDNCGWNGALDALLGENSGKKYPNSAGYGTVMEQTCVNGGAVWDGPELIWTEDFQNLNNTTTSAGYTVRNWGIFGGFEHGWLDMFSKIIDGTMYIPTREEVVSKTKIYIVNDVTSGSDEDKYAAWGDLYDGLYKQTDPFNRGNGQWMDNFCYFKKTGRYGAIPVGITPYDDLAKAIPTKIKKSSRNSVWSSQSTKVNAFNNAYPSVSKGDLYVNRFKNQLVTYTPYTYLNSKKRASAKIPLKYNTCDSLVLSYGKLSTGIVHEYSDHIDFYLTNYRSDTLTGQIDTIKVYGASVKPSMTHKPRTTASYTAKVGESWNSTENLYIVTVEHNGALDLSIQCAGNGTDRQTDVVSQTALELPVQPAPYNGPITIEAEDMNYKGVTSCVTDPYNWYPNVHGHAGNGFIDMGANTEGSLTHVIRLREDQAGTYRVIIRYSNVKRNGEITVARKSNVFAVPVVKTATNQWLRTEVEMELTKGKNTITINNNNGISMYIDNVTYMPAGMADEKYAITVRDSKYGKVELSSDSAAEGESVRVRVLPNSGFRLKSWTIVHGGVTLDVADEISFIMPDDNVTIQPEFEDMSMVYSLDYSTVLGGTIPAGWKCIQEDNTVHQYPNNYSSGSRVLTGFSGYQGKALYWREKSCEYGSQADYKLTLQPGHYIWKVAMAAWKEAPQYQAQVLNANGTAIASKYSLPAAPNAAGSTSANLTSAQTQVLEFDVKNAGNYTLKFTNSDVIAGYDEFLLLQCDLRLKPAEDGILEISESNDSGNELFSLDGRRITTLQSGVNIIRDKNGNARKFIVR